MIRHVSTILVALVISFSAQPVMADELELAYQKEYAYLTSEREVLKKRLLDIKRSNETVLRTTRQEIDRLQKSFLAGQNATDQVNYQIADISRDVDFGSADAMLLETTLLQAGETLEAMDLEIEGDSDLERLASAFSLARQRIARDGRIEIRSGNFFRENGELVAGQIAEVGRIARYAISEQAAGVLAPAGDGMFRIWEESTGEDARAVLSAPGSIERLSIFLYDNPGVAAEKQDPKTFSGELEAGGLIARIIALLGVAGIVLVITRISYLTMFSANIQKTTENVNAALARGDFAQALEFCQGKMNSASRVISATLRNIKREREHIEDIISESILYEAGRIDRYGAAIVVIAAVSPLLGLLGTVTGMISTFDIITEYGTGDPKLLSSGISEALITTKYGLVVAIPLLLAGNLLSSWGTRTKNDLERAALSIINAHKSPAGA